MLECVLFVPILLIEETIMNVSTVYRVYVLAILIVFLLVSCRFDKNKKIKLGSLEQTNETYKPVLTIFESNKLKEGLYKIDSIFNTIKSPTQFDYTVYYNTKSYFASWELEFYKEITYADSAIQVAEKNNTEKELSSVIVYSYINKANGYYSLGNNNQAYSTLFKAYSMAKKYSSAFSKSSVANDIAMKMYQQKHYDSATTYFKYALENNYVSQIELPHKNNKTQELLDNIGLCYTNLKRVDSALVYYKRCINFLNLPNTPLAIDTANNTTRKKAAMGVVKGNMAKAYVLKGNTDTAIQLYKEAIQLNNRPDGDLHDMQTCIIQLCNLYLNNNRPDEALKALSLLKKWFSVYAPLKHRMECNNIEYKYYQQTQKPALALEKLNKYLLLKDSLDIQENALKTQDINKELKEREQQLQISLLKKDNQLSKTYNWVFAVFSIVAILILLLVYYYYKKEKKNLQKQAQLNQAILQQKKEIEIVVDELDVSNKKTEKLMNIMAHELRSPISGIAAVANTLIQNESLQNQNLELVQMIEHTSSNTLALINELLEEKSKQDMSLNKTNVNINKLIHQTVTLLQFKANDKEQKIIENYTADINTITIDADKMERVISNLITNAIKFSEAKKNIEISTLLHNNSLRIVVRDEGVGMSETQLQQLFDSQKTIKRVGTMGEKSFGLGLSICKQIIEKHNGNLWAESIENKGSSFTIELPLYNC